MSRVIILALAALAVFALSVNGNDFMIESPQVTNWGNWGQYQRCSNGSYVYGARLKVIYIFKIFIIYNSYLHSNHTFLFLGA